MTSTNSKTQQGTLAPERATGSDSMTASQSNTARSPDAEESNSGTPERHHQEETPIKALYSCISGFLPSWTSRVPPSLSQLGESSSSKSCVLQDILHTKEEELKALRDASGKLKRELEFYREEIQGVKRYIDGLKRRQFEECSSLRDTIKNYQINSETSAKIIENLETKCAEHAAQLSKAYSDAVSSWAQDVSRDMPDDVVKNTISSFFQGDFFSWCADMCAPEIDWSKDREKILDCYNLVNQDHRYRYGPAHLLFDPAAADGCSSLVLLQAALAKSLVDTFLRNPYFLLEDGTVLQKIESTFADKSLKESISWRVNTVKSLENTISLDAEHIEVHLNRFLSTFGFLIQELDQPAWDDLANLFTRFSQIALKLWQTPTLIQIVDMSNMTDFSFDMSHAYVECEPAVASALGERLNGRPIGVVIRPCILSEPISDSGKQIPHVVWSKALVWVSGEKDPYDME